MIDAEGSRRQAKLYREMAADAEITLEGRKFTATGTLPEITRLRQLANASATLTGESQEPYAPPGSAVEQARVACRLYV